MLNLIWSMMAVIGVLACIGTTVLLAHSYIATRSLCRQIKKLNEQIGKGE